MLCALLTPAPERFYITRSGAAEVLVDGRPVATLSPGQFFGEIGLLLDTPRRATVRALGPLEVVSTDRGGFDRLIASSGAAHGDLALAMSRRILALRLRAGVGGVR